MILMTLGTILCEASAQAEDVCKVTIQILDDNQEKLPGVLIEILELGNKAITQSGGNVTFNLVKNSEYTISAKSMGFTDVTQKINTKNTSSLKIEIPMKPSATELTEVIVSGISAEEQVLTQPHKASFVSLKSLRTQPVPVVSIINRISGMRVRQNGGAGSGVDVSINGISGKGVKLFVDEVPVYLLGAGYSINNISQGIIESIAVYKGTIPVKFGTDALGGVINFTTRRSNADYIDLSYSYGSWNTHETIWSLNKRLGENKKFFLGADFFHTHSDNDYWMDGVDIPIDELFNTEKGRARRFNDTYDSKLGRINFGIRDVSWADEFKVFSSVSHIYREWQHDIFPASPWGEPWSEEDSWSAAFTWKKFYKDGDLSLDLTSGYLKNKLHFLDSASRTYFWDGGFVERTVGSGESGNFDQGTSPTTRLEGYFARTNIVYSIHDNHDINLTALFTRDGFEIANPLLSDDLQEGLDEPQYLVKNYTGLSLESRLFDERLTNIVSAKHYYQQSDVVEFDASETGDVIEKAYSLLGYGNVIRYQVLPTLTTNVGYEYTIRQPDKEELFGGFASGVVIISNPNLEPEKSKNINAGAEWNSKEKTVKITTGLFYRSTSNKIFLLTAPRFGSQYLNLSSTETTGIELSGSYQWGSLNVGANGSYHNTVLKSISENNDLSRNLIGQRIPNEPYLFGNFIVDYAVQKLPLTQGKINVNYSANYIHSFLFSWDQGNSSQSNTPTQTIQNISVLWTASRDLWSLGIECRNFMDAQAFDNFNVQKPGRSFYVKARFFLEKL